MDKQTSVPSHPDVDVVDSHSGEASAPTAHKELRYPKVMRFIVAPILVAVAVICGVFAWLTATIWKPDPVAIASATSSQRYIATDPGVLPLGNERVRVTVRSSEQACLAVGNTQDVAGWLAGHDYTRVEGLETWSELSTTTDKAAATDTDEAEDADTADSGDEAGVAFQDSDMWLTSKCGTGTVSLNWTANNVDQALIVDTNPTAEESATTGSKATVSLRWVRTNVSSLTIPLAFAAGLLLIGAALCATIFAATPLRRRKAVKAREQATAGNLGSETGTHIQPEAGLDSPRWVHDHIAHDHQKRRTSHRKEHSRKSNMALFHRTQAEKKETDAPSTPAIVDIKDVNLVAQQQGNKPSHTSAETMAAYFARLAAEKLGPENEQNARDTKPQEANDTHEESK